MSETPKTLGLIVGEGSMPEFLAHAATEQGYRIVAVLLEGIADESSIDIFDDTVKYHVGSLSSIFKYFTSHGATEILVAGKISKRVMFNAGFKPDFRAMKLIGSLVSKQDDSIIDAVAREFEKEGLRMVDMREFCAPLMTPEGLIAGSPLTELEQADLDFGFTMAKGIGALDIGQTVVVKDRSVMAVEAIEGTKEAILRGGQLAGGNAVIVKVSRPKQDLRFDLPAVGLDTIAAMSKVNAKVLALEAGKSIILNKKEVIREALVANIKIVGISSSGLT
jgi:DUF1009 family protein